MLELPIKLRITWFAILSNWNFWIFMRGFLKVCRSRTVKQSDIVQFLEQTGFAAGSTDPSCTVRRLFGPAAVN
jgi:hypothetical protein